MEHMTNPIVDVLAAGAKAAVTGLAATAVKEGYTALKAGIVARLNRKATVEALEEDPASGPLKAAVAEALARSGAAEDSQVQELAQRLARALAEVPAADARAMGLDIEDLQAANVKLSDIAAQGTAVHIRRTHVTGDFEVAGIRAGLQGTDPKN